MPNEISGVDPTTSIEKSTGSNPWKKIYSPKRRPLTVQEIKERKKGITEAAFELTFDRQKLAGITIPEGREGNMYYEEASQKQQLEECLERIKKLPEHLKFEPGITLIIGENGSGKSTLARALFMAMEYQETTINEGKPADFVFRKRGKEGWVGLIPEIAKAVKVDVLKNGMTGLYSRYYDATPLSGLDIKSGEMDQNLFFHDDHFRSHRQTVDFGLSYMTGAKKDGQNPGVYFLDEPETGMSPRRHRKIIEELRELTIKNSIVIVPTNSVVLFESDLPRIDLGCPERGIFRPSQYPLDK